MEARSGSAGVAQLSLKDVRLWEGTSSQTLAKGWVWLLSFALSGPFHYHSNRKLAIKAALHTAEPEIPLWRTNP
jgi:hypothetical protein